ncbi:MAG: BON domain-containing protein [Alphaproteobacteria bacterium]
MTWIGKKKYGRSQFCGLAPLVVLALGISSGCSPTGVAIGAGAEVGSAVMEERTFTSVVDDTTLKTQIKGNFFNFSTELFVDVGVTIKEGRVFLTGSVPSPASRIEAVKIAWRSNGVREVVNEIQVIDNSTLADAARDRWISTALRVKITLDREIRAVNYSIDTVNKHIYLMGIARNSDELERVLAYARAIAYVRRIISHVRVKNQRDAVTK